MGWLKPYQTHRHHKAHYEHCIALQRGEIQLHLPEHRHKFPQLGNHNKPLVQPHPQGADTTIKRNYDPPSYSRETQPQQTGQNEKVEKYSAGERTW